MADQRHRDTLRGMDQPAGDALDEAQAAPAGTAVCPFLVSTAGPWRSAIPVRDHRCSRVTIDTRLDLEHQRQYCLGSGGPGCPRFVAARAPGRLATMMPTVLDRGPLGVTLERQSLRRLAAPASVVVVGAALGAFMLARGPGAPGPASGNGAAGSTARPSTRPSATPSSAAVTAAPSEAPTFTPLPSASPRPTPTPAASATPAAVGGRTYTVRPGDTLSAIAARFGTTTSVLVKLNGIADPSLVRVGQVLKLTPAPSEAPTSTPLPSASPRPTPTPAASATPAPVGGRTYTVRPGDTLSAIAARFGTTTSVLVKLNGIADPSLVRVGQVLKLP